MDLGRAESAPDLTVDDRTKAGFAKWFRQLEAKDEQQGVRTLTPVVGILSPGVLCMRAEVTP